MSSLKSPSLPSRGEPRPGPTPQGPVNGRIAIVPHDPKWPYLFRQEADRIRGALGERALTIEHVGSTAVPGLDARPCIDVLMVVDDPDDGSTYLPELERAGYSMSVRSTDRVEYRLLKGSRVNVNLFVFSENCAEPRRMRAFRDLLIADEEARERYAAFKRELGERTWERLQDYIDARNGIVSELMTRVPDAE